MGECAKESRRVSGCWGRSAAWTLAMVLLGGLMPPAGEAARGGTDAKGNKTEELPMQKAAPAAVFIDATGSEPELRRRLREKNGVAELAATTTQVMFSQAPTGSFGFIAPKHLGLALVTQSPDIALARTAPTANAYEVHKLADGSGLLVGFVGPDSATAVSPSLRPKNIRLGLHSSPSDKASRIVAVPLVKLSADRMPIRLDPNNADGPVMLDMDLQGSTNRASTQGVQ